MFLVCLRKRVSIFKVKTGILVNNIGYTLSHRLAVTGRKKRMADHHILCRDSVLLQRTPKQPSPPVIPQHRNAPQHPRMKCVKVVHHIAPASRRRLLGNDRKRKMRRFSRQPAPTHIRIPVKIQADIPDHQQACGLYASQDPIKLLL